MYKLPCGCIYKVKKSRIGYTYQAFLRCRKHGNKLRLDAHPFYDTNSPEFYGCAKITKLEATIAFMSVAN